MYCLALLAAIATIGAAAVDTFPPGGRFFSPLPRSVITTNTIRLAAEAWDSGGSGVKEVIFQVMYTTHADTIDFQNLMRDTLAVFSPPWERVFDCSRIPDQDFWRTGFTCTIVDSAGNRTLYHSENVVIDRNPVLSQATLAATHASRRPRIDGSIEEWRGPWIRFRNSDNEVRAAAMWDRRFLYLAVDVADQSVCSRGRPHELFLDDCIEVFFDVNHDHAEVRDLDDRQLFISPSGKVEGWVVDLRPVDRTTDFTWGTPVRSAVRVRGTINRLPDADTGYVAEAAIPWTALGVAPRQGLTLGFDVFNTDREDTTGVRLGVSWCGNERYRNNNASEWGNLELVGGTWPVRVLWGAAALLAIAIGSIVVRTRRRQVASAPAEATGEQAIEPAHVAVAQACAYIREHYAEDDLSLDKVARAVSLNAQYLSRIFKRESGVAFASYVNTVRMAKARELLASPNLTVTEVAIRVGYGTLSNFEKVFKRAEGVTPRQYRSKGA
jgi:AraC-like DNA-binding protein